MESITVKKAGCAKISFSSQFLPARSLHGESWLCRRKFEQNNIIFNLRNFYNTIDYEFWLVVADRPVDIKLYLSQLQLQYDNAQNQAVRKLINQDIQKAEMFGGSSVNAVDTEYFFLFRDKKLDVVQKRVQTMIANLASCGLNSRQASDDDLKFLLQNFLNGGTKNEYGTVMSNV